GTPYGFSFWDFEVRGSGGTTTDPAAPTASYTYSPTSPEVGQAVSFDASASSCAATPCSYRWEDGTQAIGTGTTLTHSFSTAGDHPVKLTVTDAQSRSDSTTKTITVTDATSEPSADLALGRPATASSVEKAGLEAGKANDGDSSTRWSSAFADNQWWRVDLGSVQSIDQVKINWEGAYGSTYRIEGSTDGTTWSTLYDGGAPGEGWITHDFPAADVRYVQFVGLTRGTPYGFSFWDFEVRGSGGTTTDPAAPTASYTYSPTSPEVGQAVSFDASGSGCAATPCSYRWEDGTQAIGTGTTLTHSFSTAGDHPVKLTVTDAQSRSDSATKTITVSEPPAEEPEDKALNKPATASSVFSKGYTPGKANDGDSSTRWMSARKDNEWWQVDLGAARKIDTVELNWSEDYGKTYKIQVSTDGATFTDVASVSLSAAGLQRSTFPTVAARYVRVLGLTRATTKGFSFWDARVLGPADT
ncbi:MAG: discoidin domain-containing protein, partial [Chloroflexota bacterium]|nr:discoidin domain-containing protein [Chloroflexota bacterium]